MSNESQIQTSDYASAINVQDACNLSGVVQSFSNILSTLWAEARRIGEGTEWVNRHPICVLFASKIASLTGCEADAMFSSAYAACMEHVEQ